MLYGKRQNDMVYLATLNDYVQAAMVKDVLANEGIDSLLKNETLSTIWNCPCFQAEIYVAEQDYGKAYAILQEGFPGLIG